MSENRYMPPAEVDHRLLGNLRQSRMEMEELGCQLGEVIAQLEQDYRQTRQKRLQQRLSNPN